MKTPFLLIAIVLLIQPAYAQEDDFWLMTDTDSIRRSSLWLHAGLDEDGGSYYGVSTSIGLDAAQFYFSANQQQFDTETGDWSVGLGTNPYNDFSARIDTAWSGKTGELETRDVYLETTSYFDPWYLLLGYQMGEVELFLSSTQHMQRSSIVVDRSAWHAGVGFSGEFFYAAIEQRRYSYDQDISVLASSLVSQYILRPLALSQALTLAEQKNILILGGMGEVYGLEFDLARITSAVDKAENDYLTVYASRKLRDDFTVGLQWDEPLDEGVSSAGVNLNWRW